MSVIFDRFLPLLLLLLLSLLCRAALATDDPAADPQARGDIIAALEILASVEVLQSRLDDIRTFGALWPEGCTTRFEVGDKLEGPGASAVLTYMGPPLWRRRLTAVITDITPQRITIDHPGDKGFPTTFDFRAGGQGTVVEMHTWIYAPPKPFERIYLKRTQPHWQECQEGFLRNLAASIASSP